MDQGHIDDSTSVEVHGYGGTKALHLDQLANVKFFASSHVENVQRLDLILGGRVRSKSAHSGEDISVLGGGNADKEVVYSKPEVILLNLL